MASTSARDILRNCANNILSCIQGLEGNTINNNVGNTSNAENPRNQNDNLECERQPMQGQAANNTPESGNARSELNRLFNFNASTVQKSQKERNDKKNERKRKYPASLKLPNTWTHLFVCLGSTSDKETPNQDYKKHLLEAGLGEKKIVFKKNGSCSYFHETLLENFPRLHNGGGYELLRTQYRSTSKLEILYPRQAAGYNVFHLKDDIASAKIYVRPLQKDLNLEPLEQLQVTTKAEDIGPSEKCLDCKQEVPLSSFRQHMVVCPGGSSGGLTGCGSTGGESTHGSTDHKSTGPTCDNYASGFCNDDSPQHTMEEKMEALQQILPATPRKNIESALRLHYTVERAADVLLNNDEILTGSEDETIVTLSDDDQDINQASSQPLERVLLTFKNNIRSTERFNRIYVSRDTLWEDSYATFKNPKFEHSAPPRVKFENEAGIDAGGLSREFCTLLMRSLFASSQNLFEGDITRKVLVYNADALDSGAFEIAGWMVGYSILHTEIGIPCLSRAMYEYMCTKDITKTSVHCTAQDIPDPLIQSYIQEILKSNSEEELQQHVNLEILDMFSSSGWLKTITMQNKELAVQTLIVHDVLLKRKLPLDQFCYGLDKLGLLKLIERHPEALEPFFLTGQDTNLDMSKILCLFGNINSSLVHEKDEKARCYLIQSIEKLFKEQGHSGLSKLLAFMTGLACLPPLGLTTKINLKFRDESDKSPAFFAETCLYDMKVPTVHAEFEHFWHFFKMCCTESEGFGAA